MNRIFVALGLFGVLSGCVDSLESPSASPAADTQPVDQSTATSVQGCELKNASGSGSCDDGRNAPTRVADAAKPTRAAVAGPDFTGFSPEMCSDDAGAHRMGEAWSLILSGRVDDAKAYCNAIGGTGNVSYAAPSAGAGTGGGCEWKGRNYSPGASIRYTEGPIMSSDLKVFGQDFGALSGKPGPWQGCDCGSSSGKWGCI